jgi:hypothetical protein
VDFSAPFKPEVLRPIVTLVLPGTIAVGPYTLILARYVPAVERFWTAHPDASTALLVLAVVAAGFVIDDIGSFVEKLLWDKRLDARTPDRQHTNRWYEYLKLQLNDELIGQRYLRTKLTQFKFELAMAVALPVFWSGLLWLHLLNPIWSYVGFGMVTIVIFAGATFFLWSSWESAKLLARVREKILEAFDGDGPKGIKRDKPGA